ncbi:MAG: hypothetical protein KJP17_05405 [Gammaproteobacteria bacterium]|nr:hypothetical protein [Gammaproteobacteria bacterium]
MALCGKARIRYFIESFGGGSAPEDALGGTGNFEVICAGDSVAIEDSRNGLLSAVAADIPCVVTPGMYTRGQDFGAAALVIDDLAACDFAEIYRLTSPAG